MNKVNKEFILKKLGEPKYYNLQNLCEKYRINYYAISAFIDGDENIIIKEIILLAHALKVDVGDLFIDED